MMRIFLRIAILAGLVSASLAAAANRFLHTDGKYIVAPDGKKLLLRGINLGNWLVPEGYMFHFDKGPASYREISALFNDLIGPDEAARFWKQYRDAYISEADFRSEGYMFHFDKGPASYREISALFNDLIGPDEAARFWKQYRDAYISEADIRFIHDAGFNSVRIPFHSKLIEDGTAFPLLDRVIAWCRDRHLWVILDMHCAPGGQTGTNIDDSWGYPWLFESEEQQQLAAGFWRSIAQRDAGEPTVLGYDLLNEPIPPPVARLNPRLEPLYRRITEVIRQVDKNHAVIDRKST